MDRLNELRQNFALEPTGKLLDARLEDIGPGRATVSAPAGDDVLIARVGIVQGGIIAALADYAGVYAAMSSIPSGHTPCASLTISFLRPVVRGQIVEASASVVSETRSQLFVTASVRVRGGKEVALVSLTFAKPKP